MEVDEQVVTTPDFIKGTIYERDPDAVRGMSMTIEEYLARERAGLEDDA